MKKIWQTSFHCDKCQKDIPGIVLSDNMDKLPEDEKPNALKYMKHYHHCDHHIYCWKCKKHIKSEEIAAVIPADDEFQPLCADCGQYGISIE